MFIFWKIVTNPLMPGGNKRPYVLKQTCNQKFINPFVPNASFLYPLKSSENRKILYFQGVEKGCIGNEWNKELQKLLIQKEKLRPLQNIFVFSEHMLKSFCAMRFICFKNIDAGAFFVIKCPYARKFKVLQN